MRGRIMAGSQAALPITKRAKLSCRVYPPKASVSGHRDLLRTRGGGHRQHGVVIDRPSIPGHGLVPFTHRDGAYSVCSMTTSTRVSKALESRLRALWTRVSRSIAAVESAQNDDDPATLSSSSPKRARPWCTGHRGAQGAVTSWSGPGCTGSDRASGKQFQAHDRSWRP